MIFQWPAKKPEPKGHSRRARRRQSAENIAMGGYMNLDGTYNESFQNEIAKEPLPKPVNPFGRPVLPQREANAPRYKKLKHQLRDNALVRKRIARGGDDALATIVGTDEQGRDIVAPRGFDPVWDDDMETVIGHMDWQNGIAVPLGHKFPSSEIVASGSESDDLLDNQGDDTLEEQISHPGVPEKTVSVAHHAGPMRFAGVKSEEEPEEDLEKAEEEKVEGRSGHHIADERWLPWFEKRKDEDPQQWDERKKRKSAQYIADIEDNVYARGEADYEALEDETGISVVKGTGFSTEYRFPDGSILPGLDSVGSRRLASVARDNASVRDVLQQYAAGALTLEDVNSRLVFLENLPANPRAGLNQSHGYLTSQRRAEKEALQVAAKALQAREAGASPEEIGDILIAGFAPDPMEDYKVLQELALDLLPVIGEYRSAVEAANDFEAMVAAIEKGDWETASKEGLFGVLSAAGAFPGLGKATKPVKGILKRVLGEKLVAQMTLAKFERQFPKPGDASVLNHEAILKDIVDEDDRKKFGILLNSATGRAAELEVIEQLNKADFNVKTSFADVNAGKLSKEAASGRRYDATTPDGVDNFLGLFFRPTKGKKGTAIEAKGGQAEKTASQKANDEAVKKNGVEVVGKEKFTVGDVRDLRVQLHQINADHLEAELSKRLQNAVKKGSLDQKSADRIRHRVMEYHSRSTPQNPIPFAAIAIGLRGAMIGEE